LISPGRDFLVVQVGNFVKLERDVMMLMIVSFPTPEGPEITTTVPRSFICDTSFVNVLFEKHSMDFFWH